MFDIILTHEQQQKAVEQIQALMAKGVSSGEAIQIVAKAIREGTLALIIPVITSTDGRCVARII